MFLTPALTSDRTDLDVRATTLSFRRLSAAEIAAIEPLRIAVVTVRPGQTVDDLARSMTDAGLPAEWFRVLNGLAEGGTVETGRKVKIVTR
jgi:predicted Zn-dependent protease